MSRAKPAAIAIMGPTASGKSRLAMTLAERLPIEIISVDSAQVFRGMDIGTAKPSPAERRQVAHHLIDVIDPTEAYSAARFRADALALIAQTAGRGRIPLLAGGTMLYFKALRDGLSALPGADASLRAEIEAEAARDGWAALHAKLARLDAESAARIKPTDPQRIQRALEVYRLTGQPMSELTRGATAAESVGDTLWIALEPSDRSALHRRIAQRFEAMLAAGLVEELEALRARFSLTPDLPAMRCVGYRQAWDYLEGRTSHEELRERGIFATRQLAKRQLTWLRSWPGAVKLDALAPDLAARAWSVIGPRL